MTIVIGFEAESKLDHLHEIADYSFTNLVA